MLRVTLIAVPGALGSTLSIPMEMLRAAADVARARRHSAAKLTMSIASADGKPVRLMGGLTLNVDVALEQSEPADLVFVAGFWGNPRAVLHANPGITQWLRTQRPAPVCAMTTGSYFLAEAGLLDGCDATTHWRFFDDFAARYPKLHLQRRRFITRSANRYCTGSVDAVRDVMLHLVAHFYSADIAREIARQFTHEVGPSLQSALLAASPHDSHHDEAIANLQSRLHADYASELSVVDMAKLARINPRSLTRRFKKATGTTPAAYLRNIRLEEARALLRDSNLGIIEVCGLVGYKDTSHFIALFKAHTGSTPGDYRRLVRAKLFSPSPETEFDETETSVKEG